MTKQKVSKLIVGPGRLSFSQNLMTPKENDQGKLTYSTALLLPPGYDVTEITEALEQAAVVKWGKDKDKWPRLKRPPEAVVRPCEESDWYKEMKGWHFVNLTAYQPPGVVDAMRARVDDPAQAYSGRWARVSVNPFAYDGKGGKGVSLGLNNVQLLRHDEPLSGKPRAEDEFDDMVEEMEQEGEEDWT